jgi:DNA-3-methyladenine glycosylase I
MSVHTRKQPDASAQAIVRCPWTGIELPLYRDYHDKEWGTPIYYNDRYLFEMLILESQQAGLSWLTVLKRREVYRSRLRGFDPEYLVSLDDRSLDRLASDGQLLRHSGKLQSLRLNARAFLELSAQVGSFSCFLWSHFDFKVQTHYYEDLTEVPAETPQSRDLARELKAYGFRFVGPIMVQSYLEAVGVYNDHLVTCFRHSLLSPGSSQSLGFRKNSRNHRSGS